MSRNSTRQCRLLYTHTAVLKFCTAGLKRSSIAVPGPEITDRNSLHQPRAVAMSSLEESSSVDIRETAETESSSHDVNVCEQCLESLLEAFPEQFQADVPLDLTCSRVLGMLVDRLQVDSTTDFFSLITDALYEAQFNDAEHQRLLVELGAYEACLGVLRQPQCTSSQAEACFQLLHSVVDCNAVKGRPDEGFLRSLRDICVSHLRDCDHMSVKAEHATSCWIKTLFVLTNFPFKILLSAPFTIDDVQEDLNAFLGNLLADDHVGSNCAPRILKIAFAVCPTLLRDPWVLDVVLPRHKVRLIRAIAEENDPFGHFASLCCVLPLVFRTAPYRYPFMHEFFYQTDYLTLLKVRLLKPAKPFDHRPPVEMEAVHALVLQAGETICFRELADKILESEVLKTLWMPDSCIDNPGSWRLRLLVDLCDWPGVKLKQIRVAHDFLDACETWDQLGLLCELFRQNLLGTVVGGLQGYADLTGSVICSRCDYDSWESVSCTRKHYGPGHSHVNEAVSLLQRMIELCPLQDESFLMDRMKSGGIVGYLLRYLKPQQSVHLYQNVRQLMFRLE